MAPAPLLARPSEVDDFTPEEMALLRKIRELMDSRKSKSEPIAAPAESTAPVRSAGA
jgi:hypothetical protein